MANLKTFNNTFKSNHYARFMRAFLAKKINYELTRIKNWYYNVKKDFGVIGIGSVRFTDDSVIVDYIEDNVKKEWSMAFYPEYLKDYKIDYVFNCWAELAN